jgi:hypothetical protein
VRAPVPGPAGSGTAQSTGRVGAAQSRAGGWCAQRRADQEQVVAAFGYPEWR